MKTIVAIVKALKAFFLMTLMIGVVVFLMPQLGLFKSLEDLFGSKDRVFQVGIGLALLAILFQSARSATLQRHQSILARKLLKMSPDLRKLEAVKILVRSLVSDSASVRESVGSELRRLTGQDFGSDVQAWNVWIRAQEEGQGHAKPGAGNGGPSSGEDS